MTISPFIDQVDVAVLTHNDVAFICLDSGRIRHYGSMLAGLMWDVAELLPAREHIGRKEDLLLLVPTTPGAGTSESHALDHSQKWAAMETRAAAAGWIAATTSERAHVTGWVTFRHSETDDVMHMGVLDVMAQSKTPIFDIAADAETIARAILEYFKITGVLWRMTAGVSGCRAIRVDRAVRARTVAEAVQKEPDEPTWRWDDAPSYLHGAGYPIWSRELAPAEMVDGTRMVTFDIRGQYAAAAAAARLGWGKPSLRKQPRFEDHRAGYWQIAGSNLAEGWPIGRPPIVGTSRVDANGLTWVTTPIMVYLWEIGIEPLIYNAWTTATSSEILKPWAHKLRDALYSGSFVEPAIKRTYSETIGMFNAKGGSVYRPDWRDTIVDLSRANLTRKMDTVYRIEGRWPVEIYHDEITYPVADDNEMIDLCRTLGFKPCDRCRDDGGLVSMWVRCRHMNVGKFKIKSIVPLPEWKPRPLRIRKATP